MTDDGLLDPLPVFELVAGPDDELWLRIGDDAFPGRRWSELPWAFEYWKAGLLSLVAGTPARVDLQFFDGPYRALVDASSAERWTLTLWSNGRRREVVVEPSAFAGSVLRSARRRAACDDGPTFLADVKRALSAPTTTGGRDGDRPTEYVEARRHALALEPIPWSAPIR